MHARLTLTPLALPLAIFFGLKSRGYCRYCKAQFSSPFASLLGPAIRLLLDYFASGQLRKGGREAQREAYYYYLLFF